MWIDDLELLVDGRPLEDVPVKEPPRTVLDTDHEFDAGSKIAITALTDDQIQNLVTLAKIWGFLKYHHPRVTAGEIHWDYELFRIMPKVLAARDRPDANHTMATWLRELGPVPSCKPCAESPCRSPDRAADWLDSRSRSSLAQRQPHLSARRHSCPAPRARGAVLCLVRSGSRQPCLQR
jgi:hypothetical protein